MAFLRLAFTLLMPLFLGACASLTAHHLNDRYGYPDPSRYDTKTSTATSAIAIPGVDYRQDVRPILDRRCVSCHACYDAPCQLNLARYDGITRGASEKDVYATRLLSDAPTRIGVDAQSVKAWREKGFFPVLNERMPTSEANLDVSVLHRLLAQKRQETPPKAGPLENPDIDFSLSRTQVCPKIEEVDEHLRSHPTWGMPFGLPAISDKEFSTLTNWLAAGAPFSEPVPIPEIVQTQIQDWEAFLNADDLKSRLSARYIYEHWFIGHLWFAEMPGHYFELVRSRTPPGQPVSRIATRRPYDDPGVERVYYRLLRLDATPVAKTHMPLQLNPKRLAHLQELFLRPEYSIDTLPGYAPETASNPFITFRQLPLLARYRLMLEEAQFTLMGYMKGPVCRGQVALNSIDDHFWVFFVTPNEKEGIWMQRLIDEAMPTLRLPAEHDTSTALLAWRKYADLEKQYLQGKSELVKKLGKAGVQPTLDDLWDGDGHNPNAALTVFRHFDSASVERGLVGNRPQTAFVMGYPLLERMHYLLTAGFDVFGNLSHQLSTRLYMDFLRMESELNFLAFLPMQDRQAVLDHWYRQRSEPHTLYFSDASAHFPQDTGIKYKTGDRLNELYEMLKHRVSPVDDKQHALSRSGLAKPALQQLDRLRQVHGLPASILPEDSLVIVKQASGDTATISILRNSAHTNVAELFNEDDRRIPEEDTLTVQSGIIGAYPNVLFLVNVDELQPFVTAVEKLRNEDDLRQLADRFAIRRTDPRFWSISDQLHAEYLQKHPTEFGILDFSRLENF